MGSFLQPRQDLSHEEAMKLGMKNEADEVEKFVQVRVWSYIWFNIELAGTGKSSRTSVEWSKFSSF